MPESEKPNQDLFADREVILNEAFQKFNSQETIKRSSVPYVAENACEETIEKYNIDPLDFLPGLIKETHISPNDVLEAIGSTKNKSWEEVAKDIVVSVLAMEMRDIYPEINEEENIRFLKFGEV